VHPPEISGEIWNNGPVIEERELAMGTAVSVKLQG